MGLAGIGTAALAGVSPVFHDLDEVISATPSASHDHPWWVSQLEFNESTTEIDWQSMTNYDSREMWFNQKGKSQFIEFIGGQQEEDRRQAEKQARMKSYRDQGVVGFRAEDLALESGIAAWGSSRTRGPKHFGFLGLQSAKTPEEWGVPKWTGTPEETMKLLRSATRFFGAAEISAVELDPNTTKKFVFSYEFGDNKAYVFEDVSGGYETDEKRVIPNGHKWVLTVSLFQGYETTKRGIWCMRYPQGRYTQNAIQEFIRGLGYEGLGPYSYTNNMTANIAFADAGGQGELGRNNQLIMPRYGSIMAGGSHSIITDLPIAPTKPIKAGIRKFCHTCKICAENCPGNALDTADEPTWDVKGPWNHTGYKHWWMLPGACYPWRPSYECRRVACGYLCPFHHSNDALIHDTIKAVVAKVPLFNGFFRNMEDVMGYNAHSGLDAWGEFWEMDLDDIPYMGGIQYRGY
jgi:reductive dehalogenase